MRCLWIPGSSKAELENCMDMSTASVLLRISLYKNFIPAHFLPNARLYLYWIYAITTYVVRYGTTNNRAFEIRYHLRTSFILLLVYGINISNLTRDSRLLNLLLPFWPPFLRSKILLNSDYQRSSSSVFKLTICI